MLAFDAAVLDHTLVGMHNVRGQMQMSVQRKQTALVRVA